MLSLCLSAGALVVALGPGATLRWTHSVQKTVWEEDYRVHPQGMELWAARVQGTGAGMEPPEGAVLRDGAWHYRPALAPLAQVQLRHSPHVAPYTLCTPARCASVAQWLPGLAADTVLTLYAGACTATPAAAS
ncbi:MAG: DUF1850 domain-containing protein [Rhodoferax sp.]